MNTPKMIIGGALVASLLIGDAIVSSHSQQIDTILCGNSNQDGTIGKIKIYNGEYSKYYTCSNEGLADAIENIRKNGNYNQINISTESGMLLGANKLILKLDLQKGEETSTFFYLYIKDNNKLIDLETDYLSIAKEKGEAIK